MNGLKVVVTTSLSPWHPSCMHTIRSVHAIWKLLGQPCEISFYCDKPPDSNITHVERSNYWLYLRQLRLLQLGPVILMPEWVGLVGLYRQIISDMDQPLILNWQHDWVMCQPERVDVEHLLWAMHNHPEIQNVRFGKRKIRPKPVDSYQVPVDPSVFGIPLVATNGWGDSPHFASRLHYETKVLPKLARYKGPCGRYGVEGPILRRYRSDICKLGFTVAQQAWGVFLYGRQGDYRYIKHIGRMAERWRRKKGIPHYG